jgi:hypothetical protein
MTAARVVSDQTILNGKPVIAGTRISVELILEQVGAGESADDTLAAPPLSGVGHAGHEFILADFRWRVRLRPSVWGEPADRHSASDDPGQDQPQAQAK